VYEPLHSRQVLSYVKRSKAPSAGHRLSLGWDLFVPKSNLKSAIGHSLIWRVLRKWRTGNAFRSHNPIANDERVNNKQKTHDTQHTTPQRVIGDRQYCVDDSGALVYKPNEPSFLIIQRYLQLSSHDCSWRCTSDKRVVRLRDDYHGRRQNRDCCGMWNPTPY
jgi:hypothetical protein